MKLKVFSIFDIKAKAYSNPFFMPHVGMASRAFGDEVNNPQSAINKHPEDFALYQVGEYDDLAGLFDAAFKQPIFVCNAVDFVKKEV